MKVIIDGVAYAPVPDVPEVSATALDVRFDSDAGDNLSVREYLRTLLIHLWDQGDSFSGKRPFGNNGWEHDLYAPLVKAGFIAGVVDEDGFAEVEDEQGAHRHVRGLIYAAMAGDTGGLCNQGGET